jgi:hypothetical protein
LVRIEQLGTGSAFVVEDSTNPDSTPFVINSNGDVKIGTNNTPSSPTKLYVVSATGTGIESSAKTTGIVTTAYDNSIFPAQTFGLKAYSYSDSNPVGVYALASPTDLSFGNIIGGVFIATYSSFSEESTYSLQLQDGTQGLNKVLISTDATGLANWSSDLNLTSLIVTASSSTNLVRISQTGTGNALVVEDSTNPDSTPFVVNNIGNVGIGTASPGNTLDVSGSMRLTGTFSGSNGNYVSADAITQTVLLYLSNNC